MSTMPLGKTELERIKINGYKRLKAMTWAMPIMLMMMLYVMYVDSRIHTTQLENSSFARNQRDQTLKILNHLDNRVNHLDKRIDTVITSDDSIFLLFKTKH